ncbi:MAG: FAD-dependent oxidoreductase [Paraburkholderia sp.]|uniref:FAD-dependent oxidoreductase n=2 Tax=Burkholderiales TaxID=80840 RepID=UPI0010F818E2|nr:FAD-dependent oxidoreductase [Burkholderia sp. 4M9327F10]
MTQQFDTEVLICGAGAAGLTLAIELARRRIAFRLIDKLEGPFRGSRGKGIQPRSQEIFEDLGILDHLVAVGGVYPSEHTYGNDGSVLSSEVIEVVDPTPDEPYHMRLMVPQFLTEGVMRERLAEFGHRVEFGSELLDFVQDAEGVTSRIKTSHGEESVRARYLVGVDGGRSFVRQALGIDFPGKTLGVRAVVADMHLRGLSADIWHHFNEGSMELQVSLCPLAGTDMFQLQAPVPLEGEIDVSPQGLTALIAGRTSRQGIVVEAVHWASVFSMNARLAERYRHGRVFIAGDAAHVHPPTGGQGLNTSVQDAYNLGWKLAAVLGGAPQSLLDTFEEERRPVAAGMLGLATRLLDSAKRGIRRRGREVSQLDIGYPESSLAMEQPERHDTLCAGDRAPDAPMRGAAGQPVRLFNLFQGTHWTLLGYEVADRAAVAARAGLRIYIVGKRGELFDDDGHMRDAYGLAADTWVLVRPDGYVGAMVEAGALSALEQYLTLVGLAADPTIP